MQPRDADKYPATNEMFGESIYTASQIGRVGVLANETGEDTNAVKQGSATEEGKEGKKAGEGEEKEEEKEEEAEAEG
jgi:hypothetical protein